MFKSTETFAERHPCLTVALITLTVYTVAAAWLQASLHAAGYITILDRFVR
jgi:hypothetical protein